MTRTVFELVLLFLIPFVLYMIYLNLQRVYVLSFDHWTRMAITRLTLIGLVLALSGLVLNGFFASRHTGAYVPAHMEGGRLVDGHIQ